MKSDPIEVRRYPNRRLYDPRSRRYVTLGDIEQFILDGHEVRIVDSRSGQDLTRIILTQILIDRQPQKIGLFPVAMLHGLIRANDLACDLYRAYLRQSLTFLERFQERNPFAAGLDWMREFLPVFAGPSPTSNESQPRSDTPQPEDVREPVDADVNPLQERIAELERRVRELESPTR